MRASADDAPPGHRRDDGWDETVLVWNATVAKIPAHAVAPDLAADVPGEKSATREESRRADSNRGPLHYER
jgi:hypothetical protein